MFLFLCQAALDSGVDSACVLLLMFFFGCLLWLMANKSPDATASGAFSQIENVIYAPCQWFAVRQLRRSEAQRMSQI